MQTFSEHVSSKMGRAKVILDDCGIDEMVIHSGSLEHFFRDDLTYPFKANPYFLEWLPYPVPECFLVLGNDAEQPTLYLPRGEDYWHSPAAAPGEDIRSCYDIRYYSDQAALLNTLTEPQHTALITSANSKFAANFKLNPDKLLSLIDHQRARKSSWEVNCIAAASRMAVTGHERAEALFREGASELEIHLGYLHAAKVMEHELPYGNIVALNSHAAVLHHWRLDHQRPERRRSLLIDAGASCCGYAADITRTYAAEPGTFADLVAQMHHLQQTVTQRLAAGVSYLDLHIGAFDDIGRLLRQTDLIYIDEGHADFHQIVHAFFPHGLGHFLGIQVHDRGGCSTACGAGNAPPAQHPNLRLTRTLEEGHVVTIEPGLYFIPGLLDTLRQRPTRQHVNWSLVDQLLPYGGIRIEDNLVVTPTGARNLTREAFGEKTSPEETLIREGKQNA